MKDAVGLMNGGKKRSMEIMRNVGSLIEWTLGKTEDSLTEREGWVSWSSLRTYTVAPSIITESY